MAGDEQREHRGHRRDRRLRPDRRPARRTENGVPGRADRRPQAGRRGRGSTSAQAITFGTAGPAVTIAADDDVVRAAQLMESHHVHRLPVVRDPCHCIHHA
ncbi:CBS domain-containing protein [Amycolatopsis sp. FDAARGOS 1241]|nr:CBS domain-containing protein [Amycolatopsis sp. FDAARGOS 1241]